MSEEDTWIDINPEVMGGAPCLRDTRVTVENLANLIVLRYSMEALRDCFPYLSEADILYAHAYWNEVLSKSGIPSED
jgi:uncharacterized protein (DUF433 family)